MVTVYLKIHFLATFYSIVLEFETFPGGYRTTILGTYYNIIL